MGGVVRVARERDSRALLTFREAPPGFVWLGVHLTCFIFFIFSLRRLSTIDYLSIAISTYVARRVSGVINDDVYRLRTSHLVSLN